MIHEIKSTDKSTFVRVLVVRDGDGNEYVTRCVNKTADLVECRDEIASSARLILRQMPDAVQEDQKDGLIYSEAGIVQLAIRGELEAAIEDLQGLMCEHLGPASMFLVTQPLELRLENPVDERAEALTAEFRKLLAGDRPYASILKRIAASMDEGAIEGLPLDAAVALLISQRDNAYAEAAHYKQAALIAERAGIIPPIPTQHGE